MYEVSQGGVVRRTNWNHSPLPGPIVTARISYLKQEVPVRNEEPISYHQPEESEKDQKEKGDYSVYALSHSQNSSCWKLSWLRDWCATKKDPASRENPETNPITIKPRPVWQRHPPGSPTFLLSTQVRFPIASCFGILCVSSDSSFLK